MLKDHKHRPRKAHNSQNNKRQPAIIRQHLGTKKEPQARKAATPVRHKEIAPIESQLIVINRFRHKVKDAIQLDISRRQAFLINY